MSRALYVSVGSRHLPAALASGEWIRTFALITTDANQLMAEIHDRMSLILTPVDYTRWLSDEPNPRDLMRPFPVEPMRMWPISAPR